MRSDPTQSVAGAANQARRAPSFAPALVLVALAPLLLALVTGCGASTTGQALAPELSGNDPDAQLEFWHTLPQRKVTSNDEAFHAVLLLFEGEDPAPDYAGRMAALRDRGMLPAGFDAPPERAVERGTVAVALVKALDIKGGATMRLFGPSPRYATRELQYMGLYPPSSPDQTFSGTEFLGIISKAEEYQQRTAAATAEPATGG